MELTDRHAFFFLETLQGKTKVNFIAYAKMGAKMGNKYAVVLDSGDGHLTASQLKQSIAEIRKKSTMYNYEDYTANEMHALFKSKVSTFFNPKWFHLKYDFIVRQLWVPVALKPFDSFFYLDAIDNKPKVGVGMYKRTKSGYAAIFYENGKIIDIKLKETDMMLSLSSILKRMPCYRYNAYTPAKMYAIFKPQVPAKYDLAWFEEQYDRIKKFK